MLAATDGKAQAASRERRPGGPERTIRPLRVGSPRESEPKRGSSVSRIRRGIVFHLTLCGARRRVTGGGVIEKLCKVELISTEIILHFIPTVF